MKYMLRKKEKSVIDAQPYDLLNIFVLPSHYSGTQGMPLYIPALPQIPNYEIKL